jgi:inorganic triphosphatase YgiF
MEIKVSGTVKARSGLSSGIFSRPAWEVESCGKATDSNNRKLL